MNTSYRGKRRKVELLDVSRRLRRQSTDAEKALWRLIRAREAAGAKFRRQHEFGPYILDFYSAERRLAIEVDGGQHFELEHVERDAIRTRYLNECQIKVLRFTDRDVLLEPNAVMETIRLALRTPSP